MSDIYRYQFPLSESFTKEESFSRVFDSFLKYLIPNKNLGETVEECIRKTGSFILNNIENEDKCYTMIIHKIQSPDMSEKESDMIYKLHTRYSKLGATVIEKGYLSRKKKILFIEIEAIKKQTFSKNVFFLPTPFFEEFLIRDRKLDKNNGFRISRYPIRLRLDDTEALANIILCKEAPKMAFLPTIYLRNQNQDIIDKVFEKYSLSSVILVDDDPDVLEELLDYSIDEDQIPEENTITCYYPNGLSLSADISLKKGKLHINDKNFDAEYVDYFKEGYTNRGYTYEEGISNKMGIYSGYCLNIINKYKNELETQKKENVELRKKTKTPIPLVNKSTLTSKQTVTISHSEHESLIHYGKEKDFYDDEIKDMVISSLAEYRAKYVPDDSRRANVLDDIIKANPTSGICKQKANEMEKELKDYDGSSPKVIRVLENLGFTVKSGKHLKCTWMNDSRYMLTFSNTPSESRTGKNMLQSIINKCL